MRMRIALGLVALLHARELSAQHQAYRDCAPELSALTIRRGRLPWTELTSGRVVIQVVSAQDGKAVPARIQLDRVPTGRVAPLVQETDRAGGLTLDSLAAGQYQLRVRAIGFESLTEVYEVRPSVGDTVQVALKRQLLC